VEFFPYQLSDPPACPLGIGIAEVHRALFQEFFESIFIFLSDFLRSAWPDPRRQACDAVFFHDGSPGFDGRVAATEHVGDLLVVISLCDKFAALDPAVLQVCQWFQLRAHGNALRESNTKQSQVRAKLF
jgi:hypothetical protein